MSSFERVERFMSVEEAAIEDGEKTFNPELLIFSAGWSNLRGR